MAILAVGGRRAIHESEVVYRAVGMKRVREEEEERGKRRMRNEESDRLSYL